MKRLSTAGRKAALAIYERESHFFPLIAAVLADSQHGIALGDNADEPHSVYVEHSFGFAQIFGAISGSFAADLTRYLVTDKNFAIPKVRLYTPYLLPALQECEAWRSWRRRFVLNQRIFVRQCDAIACDDVEPVTFANLDQVERVFGLVTRFWPNAESFLKRSGAQIAISQNEPVAICYAAAMENARAEIDVLTVAEQRGHGFGLQTVTAFVRQCFKNGVEPLWDCFTNNAGSLALARRAGFVPGDEPYQFYTIPAASGN